MSSLSPDSCAPSPNRTSEGEVLVRVENVSKIFCRDLKKSLLYGLQDSARDLLSWGKKSEIRDQRSASSDDSSSTSDLRPQSSSSSSRALRDGEFLAVDNVSFELRRGECLGLIGHNGAGKTTLLKMLNGLIKPDAGRIEMRGRVGALIALGAGFNPILSGRENIYVNGSILGLTKAEIDAKIDDIIDFAEIGEFIDAPVQSYSSGMQVRLGFAVATTMEPDILILDEVLAVGDIAFQIKCGHRIRQLTSKAAVIFVSHSMQYVSLFCSRTVVMEGGLVKIDASNPAKGIQSYFSLVPDSEERTGTCEATIKSFVLRLPDGTYLNRGSTIDQGTVVDLDLVVIINSPRDGATIRVNILDESLSGVMCFPIENSESEEVVFPPGRHALRVRLGPIELNIGKFNFLVAVTDQKCKTVLLRHQGLHPFYIKASNMYSSAKLVRPVSFVSLTS